MAVQTDALKIQQRTSIGFKPPKKASNLICAVYTVMKKKKKIGYKSTKSKKIWATSACGPPATSVLN